MPRPELRRKPAPAFHIEHQLLRPLGRRYIECAPGLRADDTIRRVEVQGHTDPTGDSAYNYDLSTRRAATIVARLVELGVPPELLEARGYGPSRPIAPNDTAEGRAKNRRVDFRIIQP